MFMLLLFYLGKFVAPLLRKEKESFSLKLKEYAAEREWKHLLTPPVPRRFRDERDKAADVLFYTK